MKIGKLKVTILAFIGILIAIVLSYSLKIADYARNQACDNLETLAKTPEVRQKLWGSITKYKHDPFFLSDLYGTKGVVYIKNIKGHLDIDWEELGIPLQHATLEIRGRDINYNKILDRQVEEIRVGLGYRDHIVFKVNKNSGSLKQGREFSLQIECSDSNKMVRKIHH